MTYKIESEKHSENPVERSALINSSIRDNDGHLTCGISLRDFFEYLNCFRANREPRPNEPLLGGHAEASVKKMCEILGLI